MVPVSESTPPLEERQTEDLKEITLRTAPIDVRFPNTNQVGLGGREASNPNGDPPWKCLWPW